MFDCRVCGNPIPEKALKCIQCGEFQNLGYRWLSSNMLNSLIALVPISTLAFTFIYDKLEKKTSDLQFALAACTVNQVELFASNQGNRAAIFTHAEFTTNKGELKPLKMQFSEGKKLIEGGHTSSILLTTDNHISPGGLSTHSDRQQATCIVQVRLHSISFNQKSSFRDVKCPCPKS
jgi:hypothetical protein